MMAGTLAALALAGMVLVPLSPADQSGALAALFPAPAKAGSLDGRPAVTTSLKSVAVDGGQPEECGAATTRIVLAVPSRSLDKAAADGDISVLTETRCERYACHACGAFLGVARLSQGKGGAWSVRDRHKPRLMFGQYGAMGDAPTLVSLGPTHTALRFDGGTTAQGFVEESASFFAWEPDGKLRPVLSVIETTDNEGTGCVKTAVGAWPPKGAEVDQPCFARKLSVQVGGAATGGWLDVVARIVGTDADATTKKLVKVDKTVTYRYQGDRYQPLGKTAP